MVEKKGKYTYLGKFASRNSNGRIWKLLSSLMYALERHYDDEDDNGSEDCAAEAEARDTKSAVGSPKKKQKTTNDKAVDSKLPGPVQELMNLIFNQGVCMSYTT